MTADHCERERNAERSKLLANAIEMRDRRKTIDNAPIGRYTNDDDLVVCGIYSITDRTTGKRYVGMAEDILRRWKQHLHSINRLDTLLYRTIRKHGIRNFDWNLLEIVDDRDTLGERETHWIVELNTVTPNGLNMTLGGEGVRPSEEVRQKMSESQRRRPRGPSPLRGRPRTEEVKTKLSEAQLGLKRSDEHRRHISEALQGHRHTEETRTLMAASARLRWARVRQQREANAAFPRDIQ